VANYIILKYSNNKINHSATLINNNYNLLHFINSKK